MGVAEELRVNGMPLNVLVVSCLCRRDLSAMYTGHVLRSFMALQHPWTLQQCEKGIGSLVLFCLRLVWHLARLLACFWPCTLMGRTSTLLPVSCMELCPRCPDPGSDSGNQRDEDG